MSNRKIRVVKRDAPVEAPVAKAKPPADAERGVTNAVKNWISERRENSQAESTSTNRQVIIWHQMADSSGNTA